MLTAVASITQGDLVGVTRQWSCYHTCNHVCCMLTAWKCTVHTQAPHLAVVLPILWRSECQAHGACGARQQVQSFWECLHSTIDATRPALHAASV